MRVRILGDVVVEVDGSVVPLPRAKERALLAVLALRSNQALSVDQLVEIIWGQDPPASAVRSLRSHVSRLRSSIGEDAVLTIGSAYALSISEDAVDSNEFVRLIDSAERLPALGARSALTEALALWRGRPFTELADSSRAQAEATRLAELRVGAELALVDLRLAGGEHEALVAPLEVLIAEHPGREDLWRRLILALHRSHRRADALRAFQRARSVLMEQMGLEPGSALVELERLVVAGSPVLDGSDAGPTSAISTHDAATPVPWRARHRFVGRSEALAGLETAWDETLDARVRVVVVRGDPGAGKTALLTEFVSRREQGTLVAYGVADHDLQAPFLAVSDVVRSLIDQAPESALRGDPDNLDGLLDEVFVGSGASTQDVAAGDVTSEFDSARLLSATERLFERIDGRQHILVLLDDVQWIDRASAALVRRWARQQGRQLLIVLSCRSHGLQEPATRLLGDLMIAGGLTSIELGGLSTEEVALLLADQPELDPRELTMRTGGNPFLLHQLASHDDPGSLPDGVTAMIGARVRELPDSTRSVLEVAAISAGTIEAEVLAMVLGEPVDEVIARLDPAVDAGLLDEDPDEFGHYLFDHDLIAEAVRANVSHNRSTLLHRQLAEAIRARLSGPSDPMVFAVAGHLRAGLADVSDQVPAGLAAGRLARRTLAFDDAAEWLEPALEMAESDPGIDQETKRGILLETGRVRGLRRQRGARRALLQAAELASAGDLVEVAIELSRFNHARFTSRADSEVIDVIQRALAHIDDDQAETRALLTAALAAELMWVTSIETRCALADEALGIARDRDDAVLLGSVILRTQLAASSPDNLGRRLADGRVVMAALDRPNASGSSASSGHEALIAGGVALATATFEAGEVGSAIELLARVRELSADAAHSALSWRVTSLEVAIAVFQARFATAEGQLGELMAQEGAANSPQAMLAMRGWSQLFIDRGDHTSLEAAIGDFARDAPEVPGWSSALAVVLCELGRHDEAAPLLAKTIAAPMFEDRNLGWLTHRAADCFVARELGDRTVMEVLRSALAPYEGQLCLDIIASMGPVDLALGMVAGGLDDHRAALDHLGAAADLCERSGAPIWEARCHLETARVFVGMRCDDDATRSARLAFDAASAAGGSHVALVAEQMLNGQDH